MHIPPRVLTIDDSAEQQKTIHGLLSKFYDIRCSFTDEDYVVNSMSFSPDLIIVDVSDSKEQIKILKQIYNLPNYSDHQILIAHSTPDLDTLTYMYDLQKDDIFSLPIKKQNFIDKVSKKINRKIDIEAISCEVDSGVENTHAALHQAFELSVIMEFYRSCFSCSKPDDVISRIFKVSDKLELKASIYISHNNEHYFASNSKNNEKKIKKTIKAAIDQGKFIDIDNNSQINCDYISVQFHNMPVDNPQNHNILKEHLYYLIAGANSCLEFMESEDILEIQHRKQVIDMSQAACKALIEVDDHFRHDLSSKHHFLEDSLNEILEYIATIETSDKKFKQLVESNISAHRKKLLARFEEDKYGDKPLDIVLDGLKTILIQDEYIT